MINKVLLKNFVSVIIPAVLGFVFTYLFSFYQQVQIKHLAWATAALATYCLIMNFIYAAMAGKSNFTGAMLVGSVLKLLFSFVSIFVYSILFPAFFSSFALQYIMIYLIFTLFEIRYLLYLIKHQNKK